jgi:peptidyl-prolyl cis-trans isomerase SurA
VMNVCDRQDNVDALPDRDQIEDRLYSEQLGMVSERALRNLRREATIIRR